MRPSERQRSNVRGATRRMAAASDRVIHSSPECTDCDGGIALRGDMSMLGEGSHSWIPGQLWLGLVMGGHMLSRMGPMPAVAKQDPVDAEIGERLHTWMWRNRVPQTGFADVLGISQQSLGRKLRGESAWSAGELRRAGLVLRVSVGWFFGETEEEPVRPKGLEPPTFWLGVCEHVDDLALVA